MKRAISDVVGLLQRIRWNAMFTFVTYLCLQNCQWKALASLNVLNTAQNIVITSGLIAGTLYCAHLVIVGRLKVSKCTNDAKL